MSELFDDIEKARKRVKKTEEPENVVAAKTEMDEDMQQINQIYSLFRFAKEMKGEANVAGSAAKNRSWNDIGFEEAL